MRAILAILTGGLVVVGAWIALTPQPAIAIAPAMQDDSIYWESMQSIETEAEVETVADVMAKPSASACCNPDDQPGVGGNPFCFEGATCCDDGNWRCNDPDGSPSCAAGEVCEEGCGGRNDSCSEDADCCSGVCKRNGRCK